MTATDRDRCKCGAFLSHENDMVGGVVDGEVVYCKRCEGKFWDRLYAKETA